MNFLYPSFLFGLVAIAIPIIIHLFNFRRYRTVYFSNVQFLKSVKEQTKAKSQLRHLLILLSRILAIAALVLAFAQPYIPLKKNLKVSEQEIVSLYIDNSFSMDAESLYGNLLEVAKNKAVEIANTYKSSTKFLLITNDFSAKHQHFINREQMIDFIAEVEISPAVRQMSDVYARQHDFLSSGNTPVSGDKNTKHTVFVLSDFQKTSVDIQNIAPDSLLQVNLIPLSTQATKNLYIDSVWFDTPSRKLNQSENFFVKIVNKSNEAYQSIPVKVFLNDSLKAMGSFNIDKNSFKVVELSYTNSQTGHIQGRVEISDYPITYDNTFYFSYELAEKLAILSINEKGKNSYINALFADDSYVEVTNFQRNNVRSSEFPNFKVIVLNELVELSSGLIQELKDYMNNGGTVVFFPNSDGMTESYNSFFSQTGVSRFGRWDTTKTKIETINYDHEIYKNAFKKRQDNPDLPVVFKHFTFQQSGRTNEIALLTTMNKHKVFTSVALGKGKLFVSAIPLNETCSNLTRHALFIPTMYNIALFSQMSSRLYYIIGRDVFVDITNYDLDSYNVFHVINSDKSYDFIPQHAPAGSGATVRLYMSDNLKNADNYLVKNNEKVIGSFSYNYNRTESDLSFYQVTEIEENLEKQNLENFTVIDSDARFLGKALEQLSKGTQLWKLFIIVALLFLTAEILIIRLWKRG